MIPWYRGGPPAKESLNIVGKISAVHRQGYSGDKAGSLVACQEKGRAPKFLELAESTEGGAGYDGLAPGGKIPRLVQQQRPILVAHEKAGSDGVYPDALGSQLLGPGPR
jgi:hypothetical protein